MKRQVLLALACIAVAALGASAQQRDCPATATSSPDSGAPIFAGSFSATQVIDIDIHALFTTAQLQKLAGAHVAEFRIFTPRKHLYQSIAVPFSSDKGEKGKAHRVDGYPKPLPLTILSPISYQSRNYHGVSARLPLAGTTIVANSLYGEWTVATYVDGKSDACGTAVFTIIQ